MIQANSVLRRSVRLLAVAAFAALLCTSSPAVAKVLGSAEAFAVLGAATVTNVGMTMVNGDLGVSPGTSITGFPPGVVAGGSIHDGDLIALQAHADAALAYAALKGMACPPANDLTGVDLGSMGTLSPGVYCFSSSAQLTGTLTLDAGNDPNALFVFQIASTLTTAANSAVVVMNGNSTCNGSNVFWQVGSSATLGTGSTLVGSVLALASVTMTTQATVDGSVVALVGGVTMSTNDVSACDSGGAPPPPPTGISVTGGGQISVPDPNSTGRANFAFNVRPGATANSPARGRFNFVDHVTGLHVKGRVTDVVVVEVDPNGQPVRVAFAGTCKESVCTDAGGTSCTFAVTVEDHGEPGTNDEIGITITGDVSEIITQRVISRGNVAFH